MSQPMATVGGLPSIIPDIPISATLILIFIGLAAAHMTLFQRNRRRAHKFIFNALIFGFCMSRIAALVMRIVWSTRPTDSNVAIAAQVFLNAGILLIYVINNLFAQRMLRAVWPELGWSKTFRGVYKGVLYLVAPVLVMVIVTVVQSVKTGDLETKRVDRYVQLGSLTYITVIAALPFATLATAVVAGIKKHPSEVDHFGKGGWYTKVALLAATTSIACIEAGFRLGTSWEAPRPVTQAAWFHSKPAFYCFNFVVDIVLAILLFVARVDQRFHVPNGAEGSYAARREELAAMEEQEKTKQQTTDSDAA